MVAIAGDVVEPELGLTLGDRNTLAQVDRILHCAASVSFALPLAEARAINVIGTERLLALARSLPRLQRFDAVSTAYVAGCRTSRILESELDHDAGFHSSYEQSKNESEQVLRRAMLDLPITVRRPSIVVGDSRTGRTGAWKVLYWTLKIVARGFLPVIPHDPEGKLDIVPVDFVADAIFALANDPETIGRTYHLAAGPDRDAFLGELTAAVFARIGRKPSGGGRPGRGCSPSTTGVLLDYTEWPFELLHRHVKFSYTRRDALACYLCLGADGRLCANV